MLLATALQAHLLARQLPLPLYRSFHAFSWAFLPASLFFILSHRLGGIIGGMWRGGWWTALLPVSRVCLSYPCPCCSSRSLCLPHGNTSFSSLSPSSPLSTSIYEKLHLCCLLACHLHILSSSTATWHLSAALFRTALSRAAGNINVASPQKQQNKNKSTTAWWTSKAYLSRQRRSNINKSARAHHASHNARAHQRRHGMAAQKAEEQKMT